MGDDDGGMLAIGRGFGWKIELTDDGDASAEEFDATGHGVIMMRAEDGQVVFFLNSSVIRYNITLRPVFRVIKIIQDVLYPFFI